MQTKTSNWLSAYEAIPLSLKLPLEITRFKLDQFGAGQAAANAGFIDLFATVCSSRAEGAQLGGGQVGDGGGVHGGSGLALVSDDFTVGAGEGLRGRVKLPDGLNSGVCSGAVPNLPEGCERHAGIGGKLLHLRVSESFKEGSNLRNRWEIYVHID